MLLLIIPSLPSHPRHSVLVILLLSSRPSGPVLIMPSRLVSRLTFSLVSIVFLVSLISISNYQSLLRLVLSFHHLIYSQSHLSLSALSSLSRFHTWSTWSHYLATPYDPTMSSHTRQCRHAHMNECHHMHTHAPMKAYQQHTPRTRSSLVACVLLRTRPTRLLSHLSHPSQGFGPI